MCCCVAHARSLALGTSPGAAAKAAPVCVQTSLIGRPIMSCLRSLALLLVLAVFGLTANKALAQDAASVAIQPVAFVPVEGQTFNTEVTIENTKDLLGFQFDVNFDPAAFAIESIELGPFLSNTGRSAQPLGPDLRDAANGRVVFGGFTLGAPDQPGAEGAGVLAVITWRVIKGIDFNASLSRVQLAGPGGQPLPGSDTSPRPPISSATISPTTVLTQPASTPELASEGGGPAVSDFAIPVAIAILLLVAVGLYALWRRSRRSNQGS